MAEAFLQQHESKDLTSQIETSNASSLHPKKVASDVTFLAENIIGRKKMFESPYGMKALCYADFTASGKSLECIENYIQEEVLPLYGNTHTTTSITGLQTTCFRHEARQIIAQAVNAKITGRGAEDCVLFTGSGSTSAINQIVTALGLNTPVTSPNPNDRPVVFVGPFEHHSNLLPWRESSAEVVTIPEDANGKVDVSVLTATLQMYANRSLKIGSFSAASNLTGVLTDVDTISAILHQHGALAFWDYASCAPYVHIDMNPVVTGDLRPFVYKDAIFFSGHKFVGGPGSPGVLVVKKRLLGNVVPTKPGGGTVFFVTKQDHRYLSNREEREEGGTPDIIGSIRLGLAFELKQRIGAKNIMALEHQHVSKVRQSLETNRNIVLLGQKAVDQLPIFSFLIRFEDRFLHYNFVCALLNDLFGIQTRGGCQCAGPYATRLLGISDEDVLAYKGALIETKELLLRPGFSRISFPYFMSHHEVEYILQALHFVANEGWKFLPQYRFNHKTGGWTHTTRFTKFPNRQWLSHFNTSGNKSSTKMVTLQTEEEVIKHQSDSLREAKRLAIEINSSNVVGSSAIVGNNPILDDSYEPLRWFVYPADAVRVLKSGALEVPVSQKIIGPFQPQRYLEGYYIGGVNAMLSVSSASADIDATAPMDASGESKTSRKKAALSCASGTCSPASEDKSVVCGRQIGGKYPLRSVEKTAAVISTTVCPVIPASTTRSNAATTSFSHAQASTTAMSEKALKTKLFPTPPKKLMRWVGQAVMQWDMIEDGDRLLLGVSGGKDSLSLLHVLLSLQKRAPVKFELACATVDPQTASFDPSPLKEYMKALGVEYHYLSENIIERATCEMNGDSICSYCSRMKRGVLYTCCRDNKYNKLVLAQHLDDLAESFMMSAMHNGQLRTMKAKYWNNKKDIEIIRPFVYVRESQLKKFAYDALLPVINENCPACFEEPKERHRVKKMLAQEESLFPDMYNSIRRALLPLMDDSVYEPLNTIRKRVETKKQQATHVVRATAVRSTKDN
jgi:selenocysteine lyase/cysteine desulfurase/tRNA(Ile)-lysidine synthase TilS/MesJ